MVGVPTVGRRRLGRWPLPRSPETAWTAAGCLALGLAVLVGCQPSDDVRPGDGSRSGTSAVTRSASARPSPSDQPTIPGTAASTAPRAASPTPASTTPRAASPTPTSGSPSGTPSPSRSPLKILRPPRPRASPVQ
jgi:hypothetical protein